MSKIKSFKDIKLSEKKDFGLNGQNIIERNTTSWNYLESVNAMALAEL